MIVNVAQCGLGCVCTKAVTEAVAAWRKFDQQRRETAFLSPQWVMRTACNSSTCLRIATAFASPPLQTLCQSPIISSTHPSWSHPRASMSAHAGGRGGVRGWHYKQKYGGGGRSKRERGGGHDEEARQPHVQGVSTGSLEELRTLLHRIDGKGYGAYKDILGCWRSRGPAGFDLYVDHVQGDAYAAPSRLRVQVRVGQTSRLKRCHFDQGFCHLFLVLYNNAAYVLLDTRGHLWTMGRQHTRCCSNTYHAGACCSG